MSLSQLKQLVKDNQKFSADLEERILEILAHLRYPIEKFPPSLQDSESKSINISFYLFRKNMKLKQNIHVGRLQVT